MRERNFGFILWVAFFFYFCTYLSNCEEDGKSRQTYVIRYKDGEQTIPVTVVLDYKKQTEYVINMNPRTPAKSVTLYDFKQRTIAYKDLTNRECFLGRLTHETMNEESNALQDVKNPVEVRPKVRSLDPRKPALTPTEIRNIAGQKTAVFCRKMNTWLLVPEKDHSISKRQVDEYEERTYQYNGHRSSQYSHYERETRRRYRNRNQPNTRRRSQRKESEASYEKNRLGIPERSSLIPSVNIESENGLQFNPRHPVKVNGAAIHNHSPISASFQVPLNTHLDQTDVYGHKENDISFDNRLPPRTLNTNENSKYPKTETKSLSADEIRHHPNSNETERTDYELIPDLSKNTSRHFKRNSSLEKLISEDTNDINEKETSTTGPYIPFGQAGYPNVHFSLVHLLPLYKPLDQEFETYQETSTAGVNNLPPNLQRTVESEDHPLPTDLTESNNPFTNLKAVHSVSHDPDALSNVVEAPKITNEFENLKENDTYLSLPHSKNAKQVHNSVESYPSSPRSPYIRKNDFQKESVERIPLSPNRNADNVAKEEVHFRTKYTHNSQSDISTTTELPILTTRDYSTAEATTPNPLYIPSVHTAFQNSEDFNTFQLFPNYIENTDQTSLGRNSIAHPTSIDRTDDRTRMPQNLVSTTDYPLERHTDTNNRSDTSNKGSKSQSSTFTATEVDLRKDFHSPIPNNTIDANSPPYKIRYQSVLRDFKPDEIVIDIENIPTHTPAPFTDRFQQRSLTTVQPAVQFFPSNDIKNGTDRRNEQAAGTTWHSLNPTTTRYPRRISDNSRRPTQNSSISFTQRHSLDHNRYQAPKSPIRANRLLGASPLSSTRHTNNRQFHYPSRPIPPSRVVVPSEVNHLHQINHLNNLPPGVSVHPRHPQAPFADMVRSNRPPTMPFVNDNQVFMKPHRERHHRKKERNMHSCCRLRGQSTAFQSCCRNGGSCCSRSRRRMQPSPSNCCSSSNGVGQIIPSKPIQPPVRITNQTLPPIRTEKTHRSEVDNTDRCQREKMCRTLYESTQQVMVCRNAHIEGC